MNRSILELFDILQAESAPRHLPTADTVYKYVWQEDRKKMTGKPTDIAGEIKAPPRRLKTYKK